MHDPGFPASGDDAAMARAVAAIRHGALVGMPTETVYGLAADARDAAAVLRIFVAKGRPSFDPLIVHVADATQAWQVAHPTPRAERLATALWPGPLTLVLKRRSCIPDVVTSGLDTVGVRVPAHPLAIELIRRCGAPLAAPSANPFGCISPTTAAHVRDQLGDQVAEILDGGPCAVGIESTVLCVDPTPIILRPGGVSRERLEQLLGEPVAVADRRAREHHVPLPAPGLLASHYAPRAPMRLRQPGEPWPEPASGWVCLAFTGVDLTPGVIAEILSPTADLAIAAQHLFAALRRLDGRQPAGIVAELVPDTGLGLGINDRLRRAAGLG